MDDVILVLASPLNRTIDTARHTFSPLLEKGHKIYLCSYLKEWGNVPCNTGRSRTELLDLYKGDDKMDCSLVTEGWERQVERKSVCLQYDFVTL